MLLRRAPCPRLRPFVQTLWVARDAAGAVRAARERVLPSGTIQLVIRLSHPLRVFAGEHDLEGRVVGHGVIGGSRAVAHLRDVSAPLYALGAQLCPGAGPLLLGVPANLLAARHTALSDVWGAEAERMREQLTELAEPAAQLALFESMLLARLGPDAAVPGVIARAVAALRAGRAVAEVVTDSGYSHRHFAASFERAVGLTPKRFSRTMRFQRALRDLAREPDAAWARLAGAAGYSDQPHFAREFRAFSGLTPEQFRGLSPDASQHVPLVPSAPGTIRSRR